MLRMHYDLFQNPEEITNLMALILQQFDKQLLDRYPCIFKQYIHIYTTNKTRRRAKPCLIFANTTRNNPIQWLQYL